MKENNTEFEKIIEKISTTEKINIKKMSDKIFLKECDDTFTFKISGNDVKTVFNNEHWLDLIKINIVDIIGKDWLESIQNVKNEILVAISLNKKIITLFFADDPHSYNPYNDPYLASNLTRGEFHEDFDINIFYIKNPLLHQNKNQTN